MEKKKLIISGVVIGFLFTIWGLNRQPILNKGVEERESLNNAGMMHVGSSSYMRNSTSWEGEIYFNKEYIDSSSIMRESFSYTDLSDWRGAGRRKYYILGRHLERFKKGSNKTKISKRHRETSFTIKIEFKVDSTDTSIIGNKKLFPICVDTTTQLSNHPYFNFENTENGENPKYACYNIEDDKWAIYLGFDYSHGMFFGFNGIQKSHAAGHICRPDDPGCNT